MQWYDSMLTILIFACYDKWKCSWEIIPAKRCHFISCRLQQTAVTGWNTQIIIWHFSYHIPISALEPQADTRSYMKMLHHNLFIIHSAYVQNNAYQLHINANLSSIITWSSQSWVSCKLWHLRYNRALSCNKGYGTVNCYIRGMIKLLRCSIWVW